MELEERVPQRIAKDADDHGQGDEDDEGDEDATAAASHGLQITSGVLKAG
jgi:hypothetical protein